MTKQFKILETLFSFKGLKKEIETFETHLHHLTAIKSYKMERSGIIGEEEIRETVFFIMFGQEALREPEAFEEKKKGFLARLSGRTLTVQDLPIIKAEINEIFTAHVSLEDRTKTPEQAKLERENLNKIHTEQREQQRIAAEKKEFDKERIKKEYPHLLVNDRTISERILATKNIRKELEEKYPGQKFSITSDTFSMGDSIDIKWTDGPTDKEVNEITKKYQEGHFDGMTDMYEYGDRVFNSVYGGAKYVHTNRTMTKEKIIELGAGLGLTVTYEDWKMTVTDQEGKNVDHRTDLNEAIVNTSFYEKPENPSFGGENSVNEIKSQSGITIQENKEKQGIEIKFPGKPEPDVLSKLKMNGFRWNNRTKVWYKKNSRNAQIFAESLINKTESIQTQEDSSEDGLITQEYQTFENELIREAKMEVSERF